MVKNRFLEIMEKLNLANLAYSPKFSEEFYDTWFICLGRYDGDLFAKAIFKIMLTETTYPSIATIRQFILTEIRDERSKQKQLGNEQKPTGQESINISKILNDLKGRLDMKNKIKEQEREE